ncbi:MAG: Hsp20/alpha crystallin family protein [Euryarchaeota archaeon]|nr:Hsp20/alpha crystallin family protein [Euryarchaeota archaeon]
MTRRAYSIEDPFSEFDQMFEEMRRQMDAMMRGVGSFEPLDSGPVSVSYRRIDGSEIEPELPDEDERSAPPLGPLADEGQLVDVREKDGKVIVLVELPGLCKEDVDLHVSGKRLAIDVQVPEKEFSTEVELPCSIRSSSTKASYRNGVLEVVMDKAAPRKRKGTKVKVE